jgi:uncharacterized protein
MNDAAQVQIDLPIAEIAAFCRKHHIHRLALFGSVLRDDFGPASDVDVLIEFEPGHVVDLFDFMGLQYELSALVGHNVDLNTPAFLSRYFRQQVIDSARVIYERAG